MTVAKLIKKHNRFEELKKFYGTDDLFTITLNFMDDVNKYKRYGFEEPDIFDCLIEDIISDKEMIFDANSFECEKILKEKLYEHFNSLLDGTIRINVYEDINTMIWELIQNDNVIASYSYNIFTVIRVCQTYNNLKLNFTIELKNSRF